MKRILLITLLLFSLRSNSQDMLGVANSNFSGTTGLAMNPTSIMLSPNRWEVAFFTLDLNVENNFIGLPKQRILNSEQSSSNDKGGLVAYLNASDKAANMHFAFTIPSIMVKYNDMAFAFHMALRADVGAHNIDANLAKLAWNNMNLPSMSGQTISGDGLRAGGLVFVESALSIAKQLSKSESRKWVAGGTLKYLTPLAGAYVGISNANYTYYNDTTMALSDAKGKLAYSFLENPADILHMNCSGIGTDLGITYVSNPFTQRFSEGKPIAMKKYDYRLGVSLIDFGFIRFGKNAHYFNFKTPSVDMNGIQNTQANAVAQFDQTISDAVTDGMAPNRSFFMSLPTALSMQYDRCLLPRWYFNFTAVQRVPMPMMRVDRANSLSATIRYETPFFEIAVPYSFYDYYRHRIGFAMRYHGFFIGSDKLGTFAGNGDITGADLYMGLKLSSFDFRRKPKTGHHVGCPAYN